MCLMVENPDIYIKKKKKQQLPFLENMRFLAKYLNSMLYQFFSRNDKNFLIFIFGNNSPEDVYMHKLVRTKQ